MLIFIQEIGLQLFLWLLQLIDGLMEIFSAISGVANVNYHGQQVNIIEFIVGDSTIGAVFWCIFITAVGLTCIFTIVGLVKNMIANNRNVSTIVGKFFLALLGAMAMLAVVILGILIANSFFTAFGTDIPSEQHDETIYGNFQCVRRRMAERVFRVEYRRNVPNGGADPRRVQRCAVRYLAPPHGSATVWSIRTRFYIFPRLSQALRWRSHLSWRY